MAESPANRFTCGACELALTNRRHFGRVSQADYEQAKMELTGERDTERQEAILVQEPPQSFGDPADATSLDRHELGRARQGARDRAANALLFQPLFRSFCA